jgi:16S rRNA (cytidine1402-2'-O)-methyltransferase
LSPRGGELVLVATPIGNLGDLSPRAARTLEEADVVCCEDTRHTGRLLALSQLRARRLLSLHAHNERQRVAEVLDLLESGSLVALVSDAGTPSVSDPGERVVRAAIDAGYRVTAVPGPSAAVTAVVVTGMGAGRWHFEGFLPRRGTERAQRLAEIASAPCPSVVYEAPQRVTATLADLEAACGSEREIAICRELTKLHEETWRGSLGAARERASSTAKRGEYVLVIGAAPPVAVPDLDDVARAVADRMTAGATRREAAAEVAEALGVSRRAAYESSLAQARGREAPPARAPESTGLKARGREAPPARAPESTGLKAR